MSKFFDSIKHIRQSDGRVFWYMEEVLDFLGVRSQIFKDNYPDKAHRWMKANDLDSRKIFMDFGDWICTEIGLCGIVGSLLIVHGDREKIRHAKIEFGLMPPDPPSVALQVIHNEPQPAPAPPQPMTGLSVFNYGAQEIRTVIKDGEPWWVASDVCGVLGLTNSTVALKGLDDDEKGVSIVYTPGGDQNMTIINEPGLYSLILRSRKPEAKAFKRWITHEVIPSIRKTGGYQVSATPTPALPQDYKSALVALLQEVEKSERLETQVKELAPKAVFADAIQASQGSVTVGEFAKAAHILGPDNKPLGPQKLFAIMRELKIVFKKAGTNLPFQNHIQAGRFEVKESTRLNGNGDEVPCFTTMVTGKGQMWLREKICEYLESAQSKAA